MNTCELISEWTSLIQVWCWKWKAPVVPYESKLEKEIINWLMQIGSHVRLRFDSHPWHSCYPFRSAVSLDRSFNWVKKSRKCAVQYWPIMVLVCIAALANIDVQRGSQVNLPARYSKQHYFKIKRSLSPTEVSEIILLSFKTAPN